MNKKITLSLISLSLIALSTFAESRKIENLNFGWRFSYGDIDNASSSSFNDSSWQSVNLPHDFQISQPWVAPADDEKADKNNPVANVSSRLSSRGFKEIGRAHV